MLRSASRCLPSTSLEPLPGCHKASERASTCSFKQALANDATRASVKAGGETCNRQQGSLRLVVPSWVAGVLSREMRSLIPERSGQGGLLDSGFGAFGGPRWSPIGAEQHVGAHRHPFLLCTPYICTYINKPQGWLRRAGPISVFTSVQYSGPARCGGGLLLLSIVVQLMPADDQRPNVNERHLDP